MAIRAITFTEMDNFHLDLGAELHNLDTDVISVRLTSTAILVTDATNSALTEVTGTNYTAGGILASMTTNTTAGQSIYQSAVLFKWVADLTGFSDAYMAVIYNDTASRIIAIADIRDGTTVVDSSTEAVTVNMANATDLFTHG